MKKIVVFLGLLMLLPVSGCSLVSIGYNNADLYLRYSINGYATFNDTQKQVIKREVENYLLWHRKNMLPQYASSLRDVLLVVQSGRVLKSDDVLSLRLVVRALYVKTLQPMVRPAANLLSELDTTQIDELVLSFAKENNKQRDKYLSGSQDEKLKKRAEFSIGFIENLVGDLTDDQLEKVRELSHKLPFASDLYLRLRENSQAGLLGLMGNKKGEGEIYAYLSAWLIMPEASRSPNEQNILASFERGAEEFVVDAYAMLNQRQKKTLIKNMTKYIDSFTRLASGS